MRMLSCQKAAAPPSTDWMVLQAMDGAPGLLPELFTSPRALGTLMGKAHRALLGTPLLRSLLGCLSVSSRCCSQTVCLPRPWHLPLCSFCAAKGTPSAAPPWGALLPRGSVPTLLAWAPVRRDPVLSSGSPLLDANAQPVSSWGALPHQRGMDAGFQPQGPISNKKCTQVLW